MKKNPSHTGQEAYNYFLAVIFPDDEMMILDYNRVVKDLNGLNEEAFISHVEENFRVEPWDDPAGYKPEASHFFGMYLRGSWYKLTAKDGVFDPSDPIAALDVSILQKNCLNPVLGIKNPRTDERIHFVGGIRGLKELKKLVDSGEFKVAFSLFPTQVREIMDVADTGNVMPPKSTWFEPKLGSGLLTHSLDD